ncbi:hypothetical protein [Paraburkholderia solisilvae]|uniref:Uncharacterized protein n=1 Tax=Paraburkholderia solisilvae TaxID=624376 RepID=A0A6J5EMF5_9BURK|nr:hypothetical protein [Paraburkholderia solisilvae]CAB3766412.1 hypothetical protein LMG29739_04818 [Paraburkholderia solisilvae]
MLLNVIRRLAARFTTQLSHSSEKRPVPLRSGAAQPALQFDPVWHGDHWQNLLSSPMDARHYVMEDWSIVPGFDYVPATVVARRHR